MSIQLRRISIARALLIARGLGEDSARSNSLEGQLIEIKPVSVRSNRIGKVPIYLVAQFSAILKGVEYNGPIVLCVNLEDRR